MKITSKKTLTTVIWSNGTYSEDIKREITVNMDDSAIAFEEVHNTIKDALRLAVLKDYEDEALRNAQLDL